tara:strand:- start:619 stop:810 length:192 start_codon:yes stop_codon:yes gene_type:complete
MSKKTDKQMLERSGWKPLESSDGHAWFGGKNHYILADHLPEEALKHNFEDIDFLVIGWRATND